MGNRSVAIVVTPRQRKLLEGFTRTKKAAQQLVERCRSRRSGTAECRDTMTRVLSHSAGPIPAGLSRRDMRLDTSAADI